jgi:hypothetical protein
MKLYGKVRKLGPFSIKPLHDDYSPYAKLLIRQIESLSFLPDFSEDSSVFVFSDFGGEHPAAPYNTYSFMIFSADKLKPFELHVTDLRARHQLLAPYSEFAYKKLRSGARSRALPEFLTIADSLIHGVIVTISIDKNLASVFSDQKHEAHAYLSGQLFAADLGHWKGYDAEKLMRVCHAISIFLAVITRSGQKIFWYCDNDVINENGNHRTFQNTMNVFLRVLGLYTTNHYELAGFAKSFEKPSFFDDLLSITDLAAGAVQDILQSEVKKKAVMGGDEKIEVIKWMARPSRYLSKIAFIMSKTDEGMMTCGDVKMTPK